MEGNCIFPDDLVEEILLRLPVKDLLRARCVSKRWCALIDGVRFIRKHYQVQYSFRSLDDNMTYFIEHLNEEDPCRCEFHLLSIQQQGDTALTVDLTPDLERECSAALSCGADEYTIDCYGCVNGILCLVFASLDILNKSYYLALWNPATREFKTIAYPNDPRLKHRNQLQIYGFGFDQSSSDFKILGRYFFREGLELDRKIYCQVIYSLKSNSWKWISGPLAPTPAPAPAHDCGLLSRACHDSYLNGVFYWVMDLLPEVSGCPINFVIVSFNFTSEVFKVSELPPDAISLVLDSGSPYDKKVALYKERVALAMSFKVRDEASYVVHIWVATQLDDSGVPLSWQHSFSIGPTLAKYGVYVDTILMNGDIQLLCNYGDGGGDSEGYLYIHSTGKYKQFHIWYIGCFRYVESLFPLSSRG